MKYVMVKIIQEVINKRYSLNSEDATIQLSSLFMNKYIKEAVLYAGVGGFQTMDLSEFGNEIKIEMHNKSWMVRSRPYRDDTNSTDVEETIYEYLINPKDE